MSDQKKDAIAIQRFVEYIQIKTVQPEPDYKSALEFLKNYAQELGLEFQTIAAEPDRHAAVLTVNKFHERYSISLYILVEIIVDTTIDCTQFPY